MKRGLAGLVFSLLIFIGFGSCDLLTEPGGPEGGGNLVISLGAGAGRAVTSGTDLPGDVLAALRYEVTLTGPGGEVLEREVTGGGTLNLTVTPGEWRIDAKAYKEDGLAGTGSLLFTVAPGHNAVEVPMHINGGYFDIAVDSSMSNGTVTADYDAAFPETAITLTVRPEAGYVLKAGTLTYNYGGSGHEPSGSGLIYAFTMPAADVTVGAAFEPLPPGTYSITPAASVSHGTVNPDVGFAAAGATVTLTITPDPGYTLHAGTVIYNDGSDHPIAGPPYAFTMPSANVTVSAAFEAAYSVAFNTNGGTPVPAVQAVAVGGTATEPAAPAKTGFTFGGWYREAGLINLWDFSTDTVTGNITLYAKWTYIFTTPAQYRDMVPLSGGTITGSGSVGAFIAGRTVTLSAFSIAKYETTWELWEEVRAWAESNERGAGKYDIANNGEQGHGGSDGTSGSDWTDEQKKRRPVTTINWRDAIVWCNAYSEMSGKEPVYYTDITYTTVLRTSTNDGGTNTVADTAVMKPGANGYRLPTEAEWEYAARGGDQENATAWDYIYAGSDTVGDVAWYRVNAHTVGDSDPDYGAHPVGTKAPNTADLYDMSGNVYDWCWDWYAGSIGTGTVNDPAGAATGANRVLRGGKWNIAETSCTVALRSGSYPSSLNYDVGFRLVSP
jgi:uncharacterized repeat protein (TIGR02543 family)